MPRIVCNAVGCGHPRKHAQFMCRQHWFALPKPLRDQIHATFNAWRGRRPGDDGGALWLAYIEAADEARRWTAEGEGRLDRFEPDAPRIRRLHALRSER